MTRAAEPLPVAMDRDRVARTIHREIVLLAGWGRAILLQLAHPLVARGVADHSAFAAEPRGQIIRLRRTLRSMLALTFGSDEEARRAADGINRIHDRVHGTLAGREGPYPAGTCYSAHDPDLLAWVHATLLDSFLLTYERFVRPLGPDERDRYCAESATVEALLGIGDGRLPRSHDELTRFVDGELRGGRIAVTETARALARHVLYPPFPWFSQPALGLARLVTAGLLPPSIREAYGLPWSPARARVLSGLGATSRAVLPALPPLIRHWPAARASAARSSAPPARRG